MGAAPSSQWIARSATRNGYRARPLNSVVRRHVKRPARIGTTVALVVGTCLAAIGLEACQTWHTVRFVVPASKKELVRVKFQEVSIKVGLRPCVEWHFRIKGVDECVGGNLKGNDITAVAAAQTDGYSVVVFVRSAGIYDQSEFELVTRAYRGMLDEIFGSEIVQVVEPRDMPKFEYEKVES